MLSHKPLVIAILFALPLTATWAEDGRSDSAKHHEKKLEAVVVSADPLGRRDDTVQPIKVIEGAELEDHRAATLGETVATQTGVQSTYFGPGVGRPIIRGQEGARVQILSGGMATQDASTVSVDHAVAIEPFLADQIEVLKGPATLLYGSGAIGGIVNVIDGRIAEQPVDGIHGRAELRGDTGANERSGMARLDAGNDQFLFHADAYDRNADNVNVPGLANGDDQLANSAIDTQGGALGGSIFGQRGFFGVSAAQFDSRYGIPGDEESVRIDLEQTRIDGKGSLSGPLPGFDRLNVEFANTDYSHNELEGDEIGTRFEVGAVDARLELVHDDWHGWRGVFGVAATDKDLQAIGEEAFIPAANTQDMGIFGIERKQFGAFELEFGLRLDQTDIETDADTRDFSGTSFSINGHWDLNEQWHLRAGYDRAERAPTTEELFSDGVHVATGSYELGEPELGTEVANQFELGVDFVSDFWSLQGTVYRNQFNDFIYLADTGETEEALPLRAWSQADATFQGFELEANVQLADNATGLWSLRLLTDGVRAELDDGGNLPRIAPGRVGAGLNWELQGWRADLLVMDYQRQDDVAEFETETPGFTTVDLGAAYAFTQGENEWEVFVRAKNLTDEEAHLHTSFLKDNVPLPGRTFQTGIRFYF
ncbi:ligand-gated channel [Ahniella affigens]|uniref:Ligand-gated channel n=1 Tax=Ahniella affigens TaxID=2021234 RepID=A0A2P1PQB9_9GAMM|nr:TonB-dependent receptor [Ahniella affigens]AVP97046.1 ligand-gated channel [Ahniella affigens]